MKTKLYTPGQDRLGPPVIVNYNAEIQANYDALKAKRRELNNRLRQYTNEINQVQTDLGALVFECADYSKTTARLADLRLQVEAMELGIHHVDGKMSIMKRSYGWLN